MGFFGKTKKVNTNSKDIKAAENEKNAAQKQRLVETEGGQQGAEITKGQSVRRIFGN
ncbi:MAG: hypothetical protein IJ301_02060 [Clostridia bacterium]|nr:hypothetical protein [Clostridia bacterium]